MILDLREIAESLVEPSEGILGFGRWSDTCSPRALPAQDSAALSGSMILEQMAGFAWNRQQHLLEPATTTA